VSDKVLWYTTRGSAIVTLLLLTIVVCLGILTAVRWRGRSWPSFLSTDLHRSLALISLIFLALHIITAVVDPFTALGWVAAVIPFGSPYRRLWLGLGVVALDLLIAVVVTSLVRDRIGLRNWRLVHWLAYGMWPIALIHGIGTGSDTRAWWMIGVDIACGLAVAAAVVWRVIDVLGRPPLLRSVPPPFPLRMSPMLNPSGFGGGPQVEAGTHVPLAGAVPGHAETDRLLAGPVATAGAERLVDHRSRLGEVPGRGPAVIAVLEETDLQGRGGAAFPVGRKWRSLAERSGGHAVVVANGAEGKPTSRKDRVLMALRPHLVLDGAVLAADAIGAAEVIVFVGREHQAAVAAMSAAIAERQHEFQRPVRLVEAPQGYVVGQESAAVHFINARDPRPTSVPPKVFEQGVRSLPTLVQNVESLAHAALIARFGDAWYRSMGRAETPGTALVTVSGTTPAQRVVEIEYGTTVGEVLDRVGGLTSAGQGVLLGDSFGAWADVNDARSLPLDPAVMRRQGLSFGVGVISVIPSGTCGVVQTARIMRLMAGESAGQCGPCVHGLRALAAATDRLANCVAQIGDLEDVRDWGAGLVGRGACALPDGAVGFLKSGLRVFAEEFAIHAAGGRCLEGPAV